MADRAGPDQAEPVALYVPDGGTFVPTIATRGPWSPDAQHGGPVAALLCRGVEAVESAMPLGVSRLTVELANPDRWWQLGQVVAVLALAFLAVPFGRRESRVGGR